MPSSKFFFGVISVLCFLSIFFFMEVWKWTVGPYVAFLDVGQGDASLIRTRGGANIVIDGGPNASALSELERQLPFFDRTIDVLILSHPNLDHLWSFPEILRRYDVHAVIVPDVAYDLPRYTYFLQEAMEKKMRIITAQTGKEVQIETGVTLTFFWPDAITEIPDVNNVSHIMRLKADNTSVLFAGDAEAWTEDRVLRAGYDIESDILKVGHHGSKTSSSTGFLLAVAPDKAVMSLAKDNRYGHPHASVLQRFRMLGIPVFRTDIDGTLVFPLE